MTEQTWFVYGFVYLIIDYSEHLHDLHSEYPLAPQRIQLKENMLSEKQICYVMKMGKSVSIKHP